MMNHQQNPLDDLKAFFSKSSVLLKLMIINVAVFILINIVNLLFWLFQIQNQAAGFSETSILVYYLSVPSNLESLLYRPWTVFTYMFVHEGLSHIFFNMVVLYFGGRIFLEYLSEKKLLSTYILGGLAGAIFYIAAFNIFPVFNQSVNIAVAVGASASVLAILVAIATYVPEYIIFQAKSFKIKLIHLVIFTILVDLLSIQHENAGGHIAHLGGAFWGFFYIRMMKKNKDFTVNFGTMNFRKFLKYFTKPKMKVSYRSNFDPGRPMTDDEYNLRKKADQEKIDKILEKISRSGYSSLSKQEKEFLFQSSKKQ